MGDEVKILFASDFHLGLKNDELRMPDYCRMNTFRRVVSIAKQHDLFLLGGHLFDGPEAEREVSETVRSEFRGLKHAGTEILCAPIIEDNSKPPSLLDECRIADVFADDGNSAPYLFMKGGQKIYVYGMSGSAEKIHSVRKVSDDGFHVGLINPDHPLSDAGSGVIRTDSISPIPFNGLDFYAVGHCHHFTMFRSTERIIGVCPGTPEATSFEETGDRYVISIVVSGNRLYQMKRLTVNSMRVCHTVVDCSPLVTMGPIKEILEDNKSKKGIQRIVLRGDRDFVLKKEELYKYRGDFFRLDIIDETAPTIDALIEEFQYENTLRGEFFKILKERLQNNDLKDVDLHDLAETLNRVMGGGFHGLEEWLCGL